MQEKPYETLKEALTKLPKERLLAVAFLEPLRKALDDAFMAMLSAGVEMIPVEEITTPWKRQVVGTVKMAENANCRLCIRFEPDTAQALSGEVLGLAPEDIGPEAVTEMIGQLAEIVGTNFETNILVGAKADNASEVADVVAFDPALTFKLIRAANSAFASRSEPVTTVRDAVDRLGTAQVFALAVAEVAPNYCRATVPAESFTSALLHDIGKLIMARFLKPDILDLLKQARASGGLTPLEAETRILQVHHGELGGIIAQHWEFPQQVVKGIIFHHQPELGLDTIYVHCRR